MDHAIKSAAAAAAVAAASASNSKKRRIMIITADESIIEQIQNNNHPSSFQSIVIESKNDNIEFSLAAVSFVCFLYLSSLNRCDCCFFLFD